MTLRARTRRCETGREAVAVIDSESAAAVWEAESPLTLRSENP